MVECKKEQKRRDSEKWGNNRFGMEGWRGK